MAFSTRCWRAAISVVACVLLAACGASPAVDDDDARIVAARLTRTPAAALEADLALRFSPVMLDALEHGIPLTLTFSIAAHGDPRGVDRIELTEARQLRLSYAPLAQQFQVGDLGTGTTRSFARRTQMLAAFDRVRLPMPASWSALPDATTITLTVALDRTALPGPLRLPALLSRDWQLVTPEYRWRLDG
jgi:hypothetical protein